MSGDSQAIRCEVCGLRGRYLTLENAVLCPRHLLERRRFGGTTSTPCGTHAPDPACGSCITEQCDD